jgi:hypothetical protein
MAAIEADHLLPFVSLAATRHLNYTRLREQLRCMSELEPVQPGPEPWRKQNESVIFALAFVGSSLFASAAFADADDAKWVAQCLKDNKDATVSIEIVTKYCTCMNNKMSSDETHRSRNGRRAIRPNAPRATRKPAENNLWRDDRPSVSKDHFLLSS